MTIKCSRVRNTNLDSRIVLGELLDEVEHSGRFRCRLGLVPPDNLRHPEPQSVLREVMMTSLT